MLNELESLMNESRSLSLQIQEYQQQSNDLNEKYQEIRNMIPILLIESEGRIDWVPDEWTPLGIADDDTAPRPEPWKRSRRSTLPQLHNQTIDPVVSLFTEMNRIRTQINTIKARMAQYVQSRDLLDEGIYGLLRRWSFDRQSSSGSPNPLEQEINLVHSPRPFPQSRRQRHIQNQTKINSTVSTLALVDQRLDQVACFKKLLGEYQMLIGSL